MGGGTNRTPKDTFFRYISNFVIFCNKNRNYIAVVVEDNTFWIALPVAIAVFFIVALFANVFKSVMIERYVRVFVILVVEFDCVMHNVSEIDVTVFAQSAIDRDTLSLVTFFAFNPFCRIIEFSSFFRMSEHLAPGFLPNQALTPTDAAKSTGRNQERLYMKMNEIKHISITLYNKKSEQNEQVVLFSPLFDLL